MFTSNTIEITKTKEDSIHADCRAFFNANFNLNLTHFSFNGTRLNFESMRFEGVIEVHTEEEESMWILFDINDKNKVLKRTLKFVKNEQ